MLPDSVTAAAGAIASMGAKVSLFPMDTIKTRLQAPGGLFAHGGFRGVYRGVGAIVVASPSIGAVFFVVYDNCNNFLKPRIGSFETDEKARAMTYLISGSIGELAACTVRVPMEVVKQRAQAEVGLSSYSALKGILSAQRESVFAGLYRGFGITAMRDVPYTMIQFALYEELKRVQARRLGKEKVTPGEAAVCGSIAGGIAGGVTTPLDVLKTRIMLAKESISPLQMLRQTVREEGASVLLSGLVPRVVWISAFGAVYLGLYELAKESLLGLRTNSWSKPLEE